MRSGMFKRLATIGAIAASAALLIGMPGASAATLGQPPQWFTGQVNQDRATGSETIYYITTDLFRLYNQTSIFGCSLSTNFKTCTLPDPAGTDITDNYDRNEFTNGEGIGSSGGIGQLCGTKTTPYPVDFARSSRPVGGSDCATAVGLPFARDSITGVGFPSLNTATVTCTGVCAATQVGPVANGWRTGDPLAGPYTGKPVVANTLDNSSAGALGTATESLTKKIYCDTGGNGVSDWGQLTDKTADPAKHSEAATTTSGTTLVTDASAASADQGKIITGTGIPVSTRVVSVVAGTSYTLENAATASGSPTVTVGTTLGDIGTGASISAPIQVPYVNPNSGTKKDWDTYVGCDSNGKATQTAANLVQENDMPDVLTTAFAAGEAGGTDNIAGSNFEAETLAYESFGVAGWQSFTLGGGRQLRINGIGASPTVELNGTIKTVRFLNYIYRTDTLRASVAGFLNWVCNDTTTNHGKDLTTGANYGSEMDTEIGTVFSFPRPFNTIAGSPVPTGCTPDANGNTQPPVDNILHSGDSATVNAGGTDVSDASALPTDDNQIITGTGIPTGTTITAVNGCAGTFPTLTGPCTGYTISKVAAAGATTASVGLAPAVSGT